MSDEGYPALREALREGRAVVLDKALGETPLGCIEALRARRPELAGVPVGYAGRLDPLATGVLVVLVGEENREANRWRALDKAYEAEVLLGAETDAWDALGWVTAVRGRAEGVGLAEAESAVRAWVGTFSQPLPPFAAHRVRGRSLWSYARAGETPPGPWPTYERTVYEARVRAVDALDGARVREGALARVRSVTRGDFRQEALRDRWAEALAAHERTRFARVELTVRCSSGTFVRALARDLGASLGVPALLWALRRTRVGPCTLEDAGP